MKAFIYKTKRRKNGALVKSRTWYARLQFDGELKPCNINLKVTDERVANEKLRERVLEHERESLGIGVPKVQRNTFQSPIADLIAEYVADLETMGRSEGHIRHVNTRLRRLARECNWGQLRDATIESFIRWRSAQKGKAAKTLNEYLATLSAFFGWLWKQNRVPANPFSNLKKVDTRGKATFHRLALTDEQCRRLLEVSGSRMPFYLVALHTALRRGEINQLRWGDFHLDEVKPFLIVRAAISKNRKLKSLPVHLELAEYLRSVRPGNVRADELLFPDGVSPMKLVRQDLRAAGIAANDGNGGRIDFHALRTTFITRLQTAGAHPRVAMELARHSEMRLTMNTYTDTSHLPLVSTIQQLPKFGVAASKNGIPKDTPAPVKTSQVESTQVLVAKKPETVQPIENTMQSHCLASRVIVSPQNRTGGERGIRTPFSPFSWLE
jgi:integrase